VPRGSASRSPSLLRGRGDGRDHFCPRCPNHSRPTRTHAHTRIYKCNTRANTCTYMDATRTHRSCVLRHATCAVHAVSAWARHRDIRAGRSVLWQLEEGQSTRSSSRADPKPNLMRIYVQRDAFGVYIGRQGERFFGNWRDDQVRTWTPGCRLCGWVGGRPSFALTYHLVLAARFGAVDPCRRHTIPGRIRYLACAAASLTPSLSHPLTHSLV
jgi:hypothetical protein